MMDNVVNEEFSVRVFQEGNMILIEFSKNIQGIALDKTGALRFIEAIMNAIESIDRKENNIEH